MWLNSADYHDFRRATALSTFETLRHFAERETLSRVCTLTEVTQYVRAEDIQRLDWCLDSPLGKFRLWIDQGDIRVYLGEHGYIFGSAGGLEGDPFPAVGFVLFNKSSTEVLEVLDKVFRDEG